MWRAWPLRKTWTVVVAQIRPAAWQGVYSSDPQLPTHCSAPPRSVTLGNHFSTGSSSLWAQKFSLTGVTLDSMKADRAQDTCLVGVHHLFPGPCTHTIPTPSFDGEGVLEPGIQRPPPPDCVSENPRSLLMSEDCFSLGITTGNIWVLTLRGA